MSQVETKKIRKSFKSIKKNKPKDDHFVKKQRMFLILFLFSFLFAPLAWADFEFFRGVRQMGMGGACVAVVNDETATLTNPNGLGKLRNEFYTFLDPELTFSQTPLGSLWDVSFINATDPQKLYEATDNISSPVYMKNQIFPSIASKNFSIGVLLKNEVLGQRKGLELMEYSYQKDNALNVGYNISIWGGRVKWGVSGRLIHRSEFHGTLNSTTYKNSLSSLAVQGFGASADMGLTLSVPHRWLPSVSFLIQNLGDTKFSLFENEGSRTPRSAPMATDVAVAVFPIYSNQVFGTWTLEYVGSLPVSQKVLDRLRLGTEVNVWDSYFIRLGWNQGGWTAGFEYATSFIQFQWATYSERVFFPHVEPMDSDKESPTDRRMVFKMALRL